MKKPIGVLAALICALPGGAGAQTAPTDPHEAYLARVQAVLKEAFAPTVIARLVVRPSFTGEQATGIGLENGKYSILVLTAPENLWYRPQQVKPERCERSLDEALGRGLAGVWGVVASQKTPTRGGRDGTYYVFSARARDGEVTYEQWMPQPSTPERELLAIANSLGEMCRSPSAALNDRVREQVERLSLRLKI